MESIKVTLKNGLIKEFTKGTTIQEVANYKPKVRKEALVAKWNGKIVDIHKLNKMGSWKFIHLMTKENTVIVVLIF